MEITDQPRNYGWKGFSAIAILLLIVVFSVQNSTDTLVKFWLWEGTAPLVLLLVFSFALGLSFALLAIWPVSRHSKKKSRLIRELQVRIDTLEQQLNKKDTPNIG